MTSRAEYEDMVSHPGKFEGEPGYVPYFWDIYLDGGFGDDDGEWLTFEIQEDDIKIWPELIGYREIQICESDNGFVYHQLV
jgi:hypothetical protein